MSNTNNISKKYISNFINMTYYPIDNYKQNLAYSTDNIVNVYLDEYKYKNLKNKNNKASPYFYELNNNDIVKFYPN